MAFQVGHCDGILSMNERKTRACVSHTYAPTEDCKMNQIKCKRLILFEVSGKVSKIISF